MTQQSMTEPTAAAASPDHSGDSRQVLAPWPAPQESSLLGAHVVSGGVQFGLWAPRATRVELALVAEDRSQANHDMQRGADGVWTLTVPGVEPEQRYGYRVHGDWDPNRGKRFNPAKLLVDPYARAITAGVDYSGPIRDHASDDNFLPDPTDSSGAVPLSVVVAPSPAPRPIAHRTPLASSVIYEVHVKGFTKQHPEVPEHLRGTYGGMAYPAVINYLKNLGVTAIQLLPIHHFVSEPFLIGRGLTNYWGYNTLGFFAPHRAFCSIGSLGSQVQEFKEMVSAYHDAGIEVILDVVYNHTGEGGHEGPTLSFRGIDHAGYYRLTEDLHDDYDVTGTGNSVDSSQPGVMRLIIDSLRYWVTEMGVDGFRFDLASTLLRDATHAMRQDHPLKAAIAQDPVLQGIKLIAEPWDVGPYGYQVGAFGPGWSEWNDQFRGTVRDYWRGHIDGVRDLAKRVSGSSQIFGDARGPAASINFVTAHDGMTMRDLVSYNDKHNEDNGEENRDGSNDNRSWNCGVEGETTDPQVIALRHRQAKNLMATLLLSAGVPMLTAGDERGRTQRGNNNAYCQDSPISWLHWAQQWDDQLEFTTQLLQLRAEHPLLRPETYPHGEIVKGHKNLAWWSGGAEMSESDWNDGARRHIAMYLHDEQDSLLIWFHSGADPVPVTVPDATWAPDWTVRLHTGIAEEIAPQFQAGQEFLLPGRVVIVMHAAQS